MPSIAVAMGHPILLFCDTLSSRLHVTRCSLIELRTIAKKLKCL